MKITELIQKQRVFFDGGTGTLLQSMGLAAGEAPEGWNLTYPERITALHRAYFEAGCHIVKTNTFGVNREKFPNYAELIRAGISCAKKAAAEAERDGMGKKYVAFDMGPTGKLLQPLGELSFEDAVSLYAENVRIASESGADLILIETMNDAYETKAAVLAAKENSDLPVFVTNVYDASGKLMTGADPVAMIAMLEGLGVDALGMNCSLGPDKMLDIIDVFAENASVPVIVNPNAGLPEIRDGKTVFAMDAERFSDFGAELCRRGATILGGCCGTTPEYIAKVMEKTRDIPYVLPVKKEKTVISSYTHGVEIGVVPVLIGERINPTGKKKLKEALRTGDMNYILGEAVRQAEKGVQVLDVNVGLPEIDEAAMMVSAVRAVQAVTDIPLQIDTSDPAVLEAAMRIYNGKPLVNSVNAKEESMRAVFPLVKKYGGTVIGLTIGEDGIPDTAEGRVSLAERIIERAGDYGIEKKDIVIDPLAMAVSSDAKSARVTLDAVRILHERGIRTSLGVSNISFGLPERDYINTAFYANALERGLDCAIMNPFSVSMMGVYKAFLALNDFDAAFGGYIAFAEENPLANKVGGAVEAAKTGSLAKADTACQSVSAGLKGAIVRGLKEETVKEAEGMMGQFEPMEIINGHIIPALNEIGTAFEEKRAYLPQLLMSAEAASLAFDVVKKGLKQTESHGAGKKEFILATVRGDIHDIGKNIVKVMLESYGYTVHDLGRDVPAEAVVACVRETGCRLVGLSALMTTTVPAMEETIRAVKAEFPDAVTVVGGAVLTKEYADKIGADHYAADAMETVRIAEGL